MIHLLLEQSRKIAKKNTWIFTEILMLFKSNKRAMRGGRVMREFFFGWEWMVHEIEEGSYLYSRGEGTNKEKKYF